MSKESLAKVVQRAISDAGFRRQLNSDPAGALRGFDLSADEVSALRAGDAGRLSSLGIDQRMSKSFALAGAAAATRMSQADLTSGTPGMVDDASGAGSHTVIPADPQRFGGTDASGAEAVRSADVDGGTSGTQTIRAGDDYKFAGRQAPEAGGSGRAGDDWKFTDHAAQGSVAPVEGSPEASAADIARGGGMAAYPAHDGLAGPSGAQSVRAGDDWARSSHAAADSARIGNARLDDSSGASGGATSINDDPDGFLAANKDADFSGSTVRSAVNDDPDGFLAANKDADFSGSNGFLAANTDLDKDANLSSASSGASRGDGTAFIDESEAYLTKVGYDPSAAHVVTDAHDRIFSGDDISGPSSVDSGTDSGTESSGDGGPDITP